jgi:hypothetical protein
MDIELTPQEQAAQQFMEHKGYGSIRPFEIEELDNQPCWYFLYALEEGVLELEVYWDEDDEEWVTTVTTFALGDPI